MAASTLKFLKCPANLVFSRCSQNAKLLHKICQFSTCTVLNENDTPLKFSTSLAAKVSIGKTTGLENSNSDLRRKRNIVLTSLSVFLLYFCLLREENDIDEKLSMGLSNDSDELQLIDLKLKLAYCEKYNLPTANLKAKIQELVDRNSKPVFPK